ncbi:UNKNOWN [Stylonychia lemnae]|uniref:Tetraspanin family protein n=1 Tax=Stylonychia lemnae TaxID=5949 RepID=A0A078AEA3_STYLE|nr:UNKNOWN [Stylonychia lemnae]|eukprot:CDW80166.1 UNKNOWN [Stylonychia lemnae]
MCCCSVKCCRIYLAVIAVIIIIAGIVVCIFSGLVKNEAIFDSNDDFQKYGRIPFALILSLGIILLLTGLYTFITSYKYNRIMRIILGFLGFNLFITLIVSGSILIEVYNSGMDLMDDNICGTLDIKQYKENDDMHNLVLFAGFYDFVLLNLSNEFMCSDVCPCKKVDVNLWSENQLNFASRTKFQYDDKRYDVEQGFSPLIFLENGGYSNFYDCLQVDKMVDKKYPNKSALIPKGILQIIKKLENSYFCNNFCESSVFFLFRDITEGPPKSSCQKPIKDMLKRLLENGGIICFFASFSSIFLLLGLFFNCRYKNMTDYENWQKQVQDNENGYAIEEYKIEDSNDIGYQSRQSQKGLHLRQNDIGSRSVNIIDGQVQVEYVLSINQESTRDNSHLKQSINDDMRKVGNYIFYVILGLGLIVAILGLFGFLTIKCHKKCCNCCYGFWILMWGLIFGAVGILLVLVGDAVCGSSTNSKYNNLLKDISDTLNSIDKDINKWSAQSFCTTECPCNSDMQVRLWNEARLNQVYRTQNTTFVKNGFTYYAIYRNGSDGYRSFDKCLTGYLYQKDSSKYKLSDFTSKFVKEIENLFDCNGICNPGIFYTYKDLKEGPPNQDCMESLRKTFKNVTVNVGITLVVSFIFCFIAFVTQYWLCRPMPKDEHRHGHDDKKKHDKHHKHMPVQQNTQNGYQQTQGYQNTMPNQVAPYGPVDTSVSYNGGVSPNNSYMGQMNYQHSPNIQYQNGYNGYKQY